MALPWRREGRREGGGGSGQPQKGWNPLYICIYLGRTGWGWEYRYRRWVGLWGWVIQ